MEKLKPILKQRYWICFGLALIFVLVGWWNASGDIATKTAARKTSVDASFALAEKGKTEPNELWVASGKKENDQDAVAYKTASLKLWNRQQAAREWPEQIRSSMQLIKYFDEVDSKETRERWVSVYEQQIEDLLDIVKPFQPYNGEGLVTVDGSRITRQAYNKWQVNLPSSNEIWSSQEDIWLLKALLTSISRTNDSATRITESQVREIRKLKLRGGDRKTAARSFSSSGGGGGGGGGGMGGMGGQRDVDDDDYSGNIGMVAPGIQAHPGTAFQGSAGGDILAEEFGGGPGAVAFAQGGNGTRDVDSDDGGFGGGLGGASVKSEVRYVDGAEVDIGYKTRAFLLDVVIRDERLPDLLAKLTNSDFPVEIVRVEILSRTATQGMTSMSGGTTNPDSDDGGGLLSGGGNLMGLGAQQSMAGPQGIGGGNAFGGMQGSGGGFGKGGRRGRDKEVSSGLPQASDSMLAGVEAAKGAELFNAAMADPLLVEVHIGGLMTLYMTPEETEMQAKTEETDAKEAGTASPEDTKAGTTNASGDLNPGSETPEPSATPDKSNTGSTGIPVQDAPADKAPAEGGVSEVPVPAQPTELPTTVDGTPGETIPSGTPAP